MTSVGEWANYLASEGFSIIPLRPYSGPDQNCKKPLIKWQKYQGAPATKEQVHLWWQETPNANIGVVTGHGLVVVDADSEEARGWIEENLPSTGWKVKTGKGMHYYFKCNEAVRNHVDGNQQIDIRGDGGYVVGPGSRHQTGCYYEPVFDGSAIGRLTKGHIDKIQGLKKHDDTPINITASVDGKVCIDLEGVRPYMRNLTEQKDILPGERNSAIASAVGQLINKGLTEADIYKKIQEMNSAWEHPLPDNELITTMKSVISTHSRRNPGKPVFFDILPVEDRPSKKEFRFRKFDDAWVPNGLLQKLTSWVEGRGMRKLPEFSLASAIASMSLLMSRKYTDAAGTRTNLFTVALGPSGAGKDNGLKSIQRIADKCGMSESVVQDIGSDAALSENVTERPINLFLIDEFGRSLQNLSGPKVASHKAQIITSLMKLYSASTGMYQAPILVTRKSRKIMEPHVSIYAATTPEEFFSRWDESDFTNGMLGRFIIFETQELNERRRLSERKIDGLSDDMVQYLNFIRTRETVASTGGLSLNIDALSADLSGGIHQAAPDYFIVPSSNSTEDLSHTMVLEFDKYIDVGDGLLSPIYTAIRRRAMETVRKLALIYAASEKAEPNLEEKHLLWGKELVDWHINNTMARIAADYNSSLKGKIVKKIQSLIEKNGGKMRTRTLMQNLINISARLREECLTDLVHAGILITDGDYYKIVSSTEDK